LLVTILACAGRLAAQGEDPAALLAKADAMALSALVARADGLAEQKQFGRAVLLRREIVSDFAPGDEKAMTALGFVKDGTGWHRDANVAVFDKDAKGDAKVIKKLDADWDKAQKEIAKAYEKAANALQAAGQQEPAMTAWKRLARFRPGDPKAAAAMQLLGFDGVTGTPDDLAILRKSRAIRLAAEFLVARTVVVTPIQGRQHPIFEKTKVAAHGFATDHFEFWGTIPDDKLQLAAQWAERSLLLSRTLFGVAGGAPWQPKQVLQFCWVHNRQTYQQVIDAHGSLLGDKERVRFLRDDVELCFVPFGRDFCRLLLNKSNGDEELLDQTVRGVLQDAAQLKADGLWEGIGHAICGIFFGKTLTFFVEQQKGRTVTTWQPRPLVPDMKVWMEIAAESAWSKNDTPTSRLVVLSGAKFTNEERVKAWAIADYLFRTRPELLVELEASRPQSGSDAGEVEANFRKRTQMDTRAIDDQWRKYFGKGEALRAAAAAAPRGSKEEVAAAKSIVAAVNETRAAADRGPIGYYVSDTADFKAALGYVDAMGKAEKEAQKVPKVAVVMPTQPECVGRSVLLFAGTDQGAAIAQWMLAPGARDILLHPGRILLGASKTKQAIALDLSEPAKPTTTGLPLTWPRDKQTNVPASCTVSQLPGWLQEMLAAKGKSADAVVGMPLSLHFSRELLPTEISSVTCSLTADRGELDGLLACAQRDGIPAEVAQGCFVFVPLEPLPKNRVLKVEWSVPPMLLQKREKFAPVTFTLQ
jgi:hypothetical protein